MKVNIVKFNLLQKFQEKFDTLYNDPEFAFKGDNILISMICSSLQFENIEQYSNEGLLKQGVISPGITFVLDNVVDMHYKYYKEPILIYEEAIYYGEISYMFKIRNQYRYCVRQDDQNKKTKVYSIHGYYLEEIFETFPEFKDLLTIRALRRQHYYRKLRKQQIEFNLLRHDREAFKN